MLGGHKSVVEKAMFSANLGPILHMAVTPPGLDRGTIPADIGNGNSGEVYVEMLEYARI
jgi:hypothetical protein